MPKPKTTKSFEERFDEKFGSVPNGVPIKMMKNGRHTCFYCGHPVDPDRELQNIKSFFRSELQAVLKGLLGEELKPALPPKEALESIKGYNEAIKTHNNQIHKVARGYGIEV